MATFFSLFLLFLLLFPSRRDTGWKAFVSALSAADKRATMRKAARDLRSVVVELIGSEVDSEIIDEAMEFSFLVRKTPTHMFSVHPLSVRY